MKDLQKSYKWENGRNTFPAKWWPDIIIEYLVGSKTAALQEKYKLYMPKSKKDNSDNGMHINVLLNKLLISRDQDFDKFKDMKFDKLHNIVVMHINEIVAEMRKTTLKNSWEKQLNNWEEKISKIDITEIVIPKNINTIVENTTKANKIIDINYNFNNISRKFSTNIDTNEQKEQNFSKIGRIGEAIARGLLIKKYGIDCVEHTSELDKYSPFDFRIKLEDGYKYIEVKSSTRINNINWFMSRREYEFYKQHSKNYALLFVKDINDSSSNGAVVQCIETPEIIVDIKKYGINNKSFIITPISYKGLG